MGFSVVRKRTGRDETGLEEAFVALSRQEPDKRPTLFEVVNAHRKWIGTLVKQGHSHERIAEAMRSKGYKISTNTLRQYFGKLERTGARMPSGNSPQKAPAFRKSIGSVAREVAAQKVAVLSVEPLQATRQQGRSKPILPGETEL